MNVSSAPLASPASPASPLSPPSPPSPPLAARSVSSTPTPELAASAAALRQNDHDLAAFAAARGAPPTPPANDRVLSPGMNGASAPAEAGALEASGAQVTRIAKHAGVSLVRLGGSDHDLS